MLDSINGQAVVDLVWQKHPDQLSVPAAMAGFFDRKGALPPTTDDRRRFARFYFRQRAALIDGENVECLLTLDLSRTGVAFLVSRQLFPKQTFRIALCNGTIAKIIIKRCRRVEKGCFECGAEFAGLKRSE